jgi:hypothetical protein
MSEANNVWRVEIGGTEHEIERYDRAPTPAAREPRRALRQRQHGLP